jgi:hypothetical protein
MHHIRQMYLIGLVVLLVAALLGLAQGESPLHAQDPDVLSLGPGDLPEDAKSIFFGYVDVPPVPYR